MIDLASSDKIILDPDCIQEVTKIIIERVGRHSGLYADEFVASALKMRSEGKEGAAAISRARSDLKSLDPLPRTGDYFVQIAAKAASNHRSPRLGYLIVQAVAYGSIMSNLPKDRQK